MTESALYHVHLIYRSIIDGEAKASDFKVEGSSCAVALDKAYELATSYIEAKVILYWSVELVEGPRGETKDERVSSVPEQRERPTDRGYLTSKGLPTGGEVGRLKRRKRH